MSAKTVLMLVAAALSWTMVRAVPAQEAAVFDPVLTKEFQRRVQVVLDLRKKLQSGMPKLPQEATTAQMDANQRQLEAAMRAARLDARQGDIFTPEIQALVRKTIVAVIARPDGKQIKSSVLDENPMGIRVRVNDRYPDKIPLATMPPQLLKALPLMPEGFEYRFVGDNLVLLDPIAHLILDFVPRALPV